MISKEFLGYLSIVPAVIGFSSYLWSIYKKRTKPHAFSWIVWCVLMVIVFLAQLSKGAGAGAWVTGFSAASCSVIAILSLTRGERNITRSDWLTFIGAIITIPVWYFTKDPLGAVILATVIDLLAYYPTFRKSYLRPYEESPLIYATDFLKWIPALFALENYSAVTMVYPLFILVANGSVAVMIIWRRHVCDSLRKTI